MPPIELPPGTAAYSDRNPPPRKRDLTQLVLFIIGLGLGLLGLISWFVNAVIWFIPPEFERQLGAVMLPTYERLAQPGAEQDALNQLLNRLEANLPTQSLQKRDFQLLYVPQPTINAIALPGDHIVVFQGLINQMGSENELAMVLGHELGHFAHRDHLRGLGQSLLLQIVWSTFVGDASSLQALVFSGTQAWSQAQFSQHQERTADEFGLALLHATYGHVAGATDFFQRLSESENLQIPFLATHPAPRDRVAHLKTLIRQHPYPVGDRTPLLAPLKDS